MNSATSLRQDTNGRSNSPPHSARPHSMKAEKPAASPVLNAIQRVMSQPPQIQDVFMQWWMSRSSMSVSAPAPARLKMSPSPVQSTVTRARIASWLDAELHELARRRRQPRSEANAMPLNENKRTRTHRSLCSHGARRSGHKSPPLLNLDGLLAWTSFPWHSIGTSGTRRRIVLERKHYGKSIDPDSKFYGNTALVKANRTTIGLAGYFVACRFDLPLVDGYPFVWAASDAHWFNRSCLDRHHCASIDQILRPWIRGEEVRRRFDLPPWGHHDKLLSLCSTMDVQ